MPYQVTIVLNNENNNESGSKHGIDAFAYKHIYQELKYNQANHCFFSFMPHH